MGYASNGLTLNQFTMFAVPFNHVSDTKGLMLNSDLTVENATKHNVYGNADQIWVWVPARETYDMFFINNAGEWRTANPAKTLFEATAGYENGLPIGSAMYYKAHKNGVIAKTVTYAGEIEKEPEVELPLALNQFTMVANPYPTALFLNNAEQLEITNPTKHNVYGNADQIWVWVPARETYDMFFINNAGEWRTANPAKTLFEATAGYENGLGVGSAIYYKAHKNGTAAKSITYKKTF